MKALLQRVGWAQVEVDGVVLGRIDAGLLAYVGVEADDDQVRAQTLAEKIAYLRIFEDKDGKLNLNVQDVRGGVLVVPNFTLLADAAKGRRPAFTRAAPPELARSLYEALIYALERQGCIVASGRFGAHMRIRSEGDGPVNLLLDVPFAGGRTKDR